MTCPSHFSLSDHSNDGIKYEALYRAIFSNQNVLVQNNSFITSLLPQEKGTD
jgi:hypothetical protein